MKGVDVDISKFTVEDLIAAKHYWVTACEGVDADLSLKQVLRLKDVGLLSAVWITSKSKGRWLSTWNEELPVVVKEFLKLYNDPVFIQWWARGHNPDKRTIAEYQQSLVTA